MKTARGFTLKMLGALALIAVVFATSAPRSFAAAPCTEPAQCRTTMTVAGGREITLYLSAPLDLPRPEIRRAIVVVHGTGSDADGYFRIMGRAASMAGQADETLIVAPRFVAQSNKAVGEREVFWSGGDWRAGDLSSRDTPPRVSSFAIMDRLLARIADRQHFPNLSTLVLAGHSAGGQFVQRYAIGERDNPALSSLKMRYIAANPASYLYLDARRADPNQPGAFSENADAACRANRFKYGFEQANSYFMNRSLPEMIERYRARQVVYLLGESDIDPNAPDLTRNCAAMTQGPNRLARGMTFKTYMDAFYRPHAHRLITVPRVGHSGRLMFQSAQGLAALFE